VNICEYMNEIIPKLALICNLATVLGCYLRARDNICPNILQVNITVHPSNISTRSSQDLMQLPRGVYIQYIFQDYPLQTKREITAWGYYICRSWQHARYTE